MITILMTTKNRRDFVEKALWHIYETSADEERQIFIWDNGSTDDTPDFLGTMVGWPGVRVFRSKTDRGVIAPKWWMLDRVRTPYAFTMDDDIFLLNRGWAAAVARVLAGDPSVGAVGIGPAYHESSDFGISHGKLARPFFRVVPIAPGPRAGVPHYVVTPEGCRREHVDGEQVVTPAEGLRLPFALSGNACAWRVADLQGVPRRGDSADLREVWGFPLQERGLREASILGYGMYHPSPAPLWYLGRYEGYWRERAARSQEWYGRPGNEQAEWLERARRESGWGQTLEDVDDVRD